jgi:tetratricopeptide (TPR) repeat protein
MDSRAPTVEDLIRLAREDIGRNSLTSAEKTLEQVVLIDNQIAETYYLLGYVYSKRGKFKKAILCFQKCLSLDPFHTDSAIALSTLFNDVGKYREGAEIFLKTRSRLDKAPPGHDPRINQTLGRKHFELGLLYMRFERFKEAKHEFTKALNLEPDNVSVSVQIAKCFAKTGDKISAISFLRKTLARQPKSVEAKVQLGILLHSQNLLKDAQREWQEALTLEPENPTVQMYLSMLDYEPSVSLDA